MTDWDDCGPCSLRRPLVCAGFETSPDDSGVSSVFLELLALLELSNLKLSREGRFPLRPAPAFAVNDSGPIFVTELS